MLRLFTLHSYSTLILVARQPRLFFGRQQSRKKCFECWQQNGEVDEGTDPRDENEIEIEIGIEIGAEIGTETELRTGNFRLKFFAQFF